MTLRQRFTDDQIEHVIEQGMIYMCACPAQVAQAMRSLRGLYDYQQSCLITEGNDARVHAAIAKATQAAHTIMEDCMQEVLTIEQWDPVTLDMPANLRQRQLDEL